MTKFKIPHSKPYIPEGTKELVSKTIDSGWLTSGPRVQEFEELLCEKTGYKHAICTSSCTTALMVSSIYAHEALRVSEAKAAVSPFLPSFTYAATANAILEEGDFGRARYLDCDKDWPLVCISESKARSNLLLPTIWVPVAIAGCRAIGFWGDKSVFRKIRNDLSAESKEWFVIEDAAQCFPIAQNFPFKTITCTSFWPSKMITTGEGGCILTNSGCVEHYCRKMINHGIESKPYPWNRVCTDRGYNFRMSDINAALGIPQIQKIDWIISKRKELAARYIGHLGDLCVFPVEYSQHQMLLIKVDPLVRDALVLHLRSHSIEASVHYDPPLHLQKRYGLSATWRLPNTEMWSKSLVTLPIFPDMTEDEVQFVSETTLKFLESCRTTILN